MSEGAISPESNAAVLERPSIGTITLQGEFLTQVGILTPDAKVRLEEETYGPIFRIGGGSFKEAYYNSGSDEVFLIINSMKQSIPLSNLRSQVEFYQKHNNSPTFKNVVVPITRVIKDERGEVVGMVQPFFGVSIQEYKKNGQRPTQRQIDWFIGSYQRLIEESGFAHGEFVNTYVVNWDNVRISKDGDLRFIDYHGSGGAIAFDGHHRPNSENFTKIRDADPQRAKEALYQFFGYASIDVRKLN